MMKKGLLALLLLAIFSCLPDNLTTMTAYNIRDQWVFESGEVVETLDLYIEKAKPTFTWTRKVSGVDVVPPIKGHYSVRAVYDYSQTWSILVLEPEEKDSYIYSFKATLSKDKRVLTLEGNDITTYYRVEKEKETKKEEAK